MKKLTKISLGILLAFVLFFSNISVGPLTDQDATEVQAAVKISKKKLTLYVKKSVTLKIKGTKNKAKWTSSNKKIVKVNKKGKITAVKAGKATITAKIGKKKYICKVTVKNPTISMASLTLDAGKTAALTVSNAVGAVTWTSSNNAVATVSSTGVVKGIARGTATITAIASGVRLSCTVTVNEVPAVTPTPTPTPPPAPAVVNVTGVTLDEVDSILVGETIQLTATVTPANATNKNLVWTSDVEDVATVDNNGVVTGIKDGSTIIIVTTEDGGITDSIEINVISQPVEVTGVTLDKDTLSLLVGETGTLTATVLPEDATNKGVTWASSDTSVAQVDGSGKVTAISAGTARITVTTNDQGKTAYADVTVTPQPVKVTDVTLDQVTATVNVGGSVKLTATVIPEDADNKNVTWTSDNEDIAKVDQDGTVTGVAAGTATITVTTEDQGKTASATVTVTQPVEEISLDSSAFDLYVGKTHTLKATITPENATNQKIIWTSSDPDVATVDENGVVTGVGVDSSTKKGIATITATTEDQGRTASATVTVTYAVEMIDVTSAPDTLYIGDTFIIRAAAYPRTAFDTSLNYTSADPSIATVNQTTGAITPVNVGNTVITINSVSNPEITKTVNVTVGFDESKYFDITDVSMSGLVKYSTIEGNLSILSIYGQSPAMPNLNEDSVDTYYDGVKREIVNSDIDDYDKMLVLSYGDYSKTYYIEYLYVTTFNDDIYALGDIDAINVGENVATDLSTVVSDAVKIYSFTPAVSASYTFKSSYIDDSDEYDIAGTLYDSEKTFIAECDEGGNFEITRDLEAGKVYYIAVYTDEDSVVINVSVNLD